MHQNPAFCQDWFFLCHQDKEVGNVKRFIVRLILHTFWFHSEYWTYLVFLMCIRTSERFIDQHSQKHFGSRNSIAKLMGEQNSSAEWKQAWKDEEMFQRIKLFTTKMIQFCQVSYYRQYPCLFFSPGISYFLSRWKNLCVRNKTTALLDFFPHVGDKMYACLKMEREKCGKKILCCT